MKFCSKCGNELLDYAVVCTKCGCLVEQPTMNSPQPSASPQGFVDNLTLRTKTSHFLPTLFNFIFDLFAILSGFMIGKAIAESWVSVGVSSYSYYSLNAYWNTDEVFIILALVTAICSAICALTSLIVTLVNRDKIQIIFSSIKRVFLSIALILLSVSFI